ncbi:MAG: hypothetical protein AB4372_27465, partial [Xenococcus sp. (in: cyanobacteria)]
NSRVFQKYLNNKKKYPVKLLKNTVIIVDKKISNYTEALGILTHNTIKFRNNWCFPHKILNFLV